MSPFARCSSVQPRKQPRLGALLLLGWVLSALGGCSLTSDLGDLRERAEEAQRIPRLDCDETPEDPQCREPVVCSDDDDCAGYCDDNDLCRPNTCDDDVTSPGESARDCGGMDCEPCPNGQMCRVASDCLSGHCDDDHLCAVPDMADPPEPDAGPPVVIPDDGGGVTPSDADTDADDTCYPGCSCMTIAQEERVYCTEEPLPWAGATSWCEMRGYRLTSIETLAENDALGNAAEWLDLDAFWIGASDRSSEGEWMWTDGTALWEGGPASCPDGAVPGPDNRCYLATDTDDYAATYEECLMVGPGWALVTIDSPEENAFVRQLIADTAASRSATYVEGWIGANDIHEEGVWGWVLADPDHTRVDPFWMGGSGGMRIDAADFTYWTGADPGGGAGEDCALMSGNSGRWSDGACSFDARMGICEGPLRGPLLNRFQRFANAEPSEPDCLSYNADDFRWYAVDCSMPKAFVCSMP